MLATLEDLRVVESRPTLLDLTESEVEALVTLGKELASRSTWWGGSIQDPSRSVIAAEPLRGGRYRVTFRDVIGVVRIGTKQFTVEPKIPLNHFEFIASNSELAPRISSSVVHVNQGAEFVSVLARWCIEAAEKLLRNGLRKDYSTVIDSIDEVRGRIDPVQTALLNSMGVMQAACEYQDFSDDTTLNRVVKAACQRVSSIDKLDPITRTKARQIAFRMDGVGPLKTYDLRAKVDRLSASYATVLPLSILVLSGLGITISAGRQIGTAFLVRTPELIEDGLRSIMRNSLFGVKVSKRRLMLNDSGLSINPDLVFGDSGAIGDVKYRALAKDWSKSDLNQIVTFATGFRTNWAALFGFSTEATSILPRKVSVGDVNAIAFSWIALENQNPEESAARLLAEVSAWLKQIGLLQLEPTSEALG